MSEAVANLEPSHRRESHRDEMNFAEFPLASLSTSLPKEQKSLEFTDEIFDKSVNKRVTRKLTITASDKFGLPTAMDDEVILGLIQLTGKSDFEDRRIFFTRYELLRLLNWSDTTRNYRRLEQSLNRWLGVTLYYEKAWWSKEEQSWVNEGFHILDHVQILDQERQRRASQKGLPHAGKSSFVWNEVVFNSFKAGNLKQIDFEFYKKLDSAVSKRMYRFLDKRFYNRQRLEFDLRTFCCEHIGLAKNYHTGELKRVLAPAIDELQRLGFIETTSKELRFERKARGEWSIVFVKASKHAVPSIEEAPLVQNLVDRGISTASSRSLVAKNRQETVREKIALFDWLRTRNDPRVKKNPAGFLYRSITDDFPLPDDYRKATAGNVKILEQRPSVPNRLATVHAAAPGNHSTPAATDRSAIDNFWNGIEPEEQGRIESEIVKTAPLFLREQYLNGRKDKGLLFQTVRQAIIDDYVRKILVQKSVA